MEYKKIIIFCMAVLFIASSAMASTEMRITAQKYDPYPAQTGQYMTLWLDVSNFGDTIAHNVKVEVLPEYPFYPDVNNTQYIRTLEPYQDFLAQFNKIRVDSNAVEGVNKLNIKYSHDDFSVEMYIDVLVKSSSPKLSIGSIISEPDRMTADTTDVKLTLELQNIGNGNADMITSNLVLPEGFSASNSYSDHFNFGTIEKDSSKTGTFYIDIGKGVPSGTHRTQLFVQYKEGNSNGVRNVSIPFELNLKPSPSFYIEKTEIDIPSRIQGDIIAYLVEGNTTVTPSIITQGDKGTVHLTIRNIGEDFAKSASVQIYKQSDQPFIFDNKYDYLGDIQPNQTAEAVFTFTVDKGAALKTYILKAEIRHLEGTNVKVSENSFTIDVEKSGETPTIVYLGIIAFVAVIAFIGWKYAKRKK